MTLRFLDDFDLIDESKHILNVYYQGKLDGKAYEETNEYVKAQNKSIFDSLSKPMDYVTIENYWLLVGVTFPLTELSKPNIKELTIHLSSREEDEKRFERWEQITQTRLKYLRVGNDWNMVKQFIKSIVIIIDDDGNKVLWFEPPFPKMSHKLIQLDDMYYKYPPHATDQYDVGYRFTEEQLNFLMNWLKNGYASEYNGLFPIKEKWMVIRAFLKSFIIYAVNSNCVEVGVPDRWNDLIQLAGMRCVFSKNSVQGIQGYKIGYRFTDEQVEKFLKRTIFGKAENYKVAFLS
jgi:hypothetical protein